MTSPVHKYRLFIHGLISTQERSSVSLTGENSTLTTRSVSKATCYSDRATGGGICSVETVIVGKERKPGEAKLVLSGNSLEIPLQDASGSYQRWKFSRISS